jgi:predicted DNA-binding transcriptional regulator AlpA
MSVRLYPPDFCDEDTMAYLLGLASSTFRQYVAAGLLPGPLKIGNKPRWHRATVVERLAESAAPASNAAPDIMEAAYGKTKGARRNAA